MTRWPIRQVAYAVPDPVAAALAHSAIYGSGPFYRADNIPVRDFTYRGQPGTFEHSITIGQWGDLMIEFFVQHNPGPSHVTDMIPVGSLAPAFHHTALIPEDFEGAIAHFVSNGFEVASRFIVGKETSFGVVMIDTRRLNGHMTELYPDCEAVRGAYAMCRDAAASDFDPAVIRAVEFT
jgi:hypothetical protein